MHEDFSLAGLYWICILLAIAYMVAEVITSKPSDANEAYTAAAFILVGIQRAVNHLQK